MESLRVLLVDDSAFVRSTLERIISSDPELAVAYSARNGADALQYLRDNKVDCIVLDVEMPVMGGLDTLRELQRLNDPTPVIMFSSLTERGGQLTLNALALGAKDYMTKPGAGLSQEEAYANIEAALIPRIKALATHRRILDLQSRAPIHCSSPLSARASKDPAPRILVVAASTGGPQALSELLRPLPANFPIPIVVVQHMPAAFTAVLSERLDLECKLKIGEAIDGETLAPGHVWIAPGGRHLKISRSAKGHMVLRLDDSPAVNGCRPAADILFESAAHLFGRHCLGLVLTGMGRDGFAGAEIIKQVRGRILAQDAESSVVWGMPGSVVRGGLADAVFPVRAMAATLQQLAHGNLVSS